MKTYLAFYGDCYYPRGGMRDFIGDYDTKEEAIQAIEEAHKKNRPDDLKWEWAWANVWSTIDRHAVSGRSGQLRAIEELIDLAQDCCPAERIDYLHNIINRL
jgi:hypothetical protein